MQLQYNVDHTFIQLISVLQRLDSAAYAKPSVILHNNSVGQHIRHIIESFQCLEQGYVTGVVNYENRKRDVAIEIDKDLAVSLLLQISEGLRKQDKVLSLEAQYSEVHENEPVVLITNYYREIAYNLEHTIHHMALIRIGIGEVGGFTVPENFGIAPSTVKYRKQCAQ